jgi:hypothetical protein
MLLHQNSLDVQLHMEAVDGNSTSPVALMSTLYRYVIMARVCETSSTDVWSVPAPAPASGRRLLQQPHLLRAATEKALSLLGTADMTLPQSFQGSVASRHALELLPMLFKQFKCATTYPGISPHSSAGCQYLARLRLQASIRYNSILRHCVSQGVTPV